MTQPVPQGQPVADRPLEGPGSLGRLLPRLAALIIDWAMCSVIAAAFLGYRWGGSGTEGFKPLLVFAIENIFLVGTIGFTVGHRIMGFIVQREDGRPAGPLAASVRTALLCLAIPAVVTDGSGRGYHDKLAGTVILRTR